MRELGFVHVFQPPADPAAPILLLLHGTGGDEQALLPLAGRLAPAAGILSPRGQVLERGMPRFFRRLAEGVFDLDDLRRRTAVLADFVEAAASNYGFPREKVIAVGFSNGANVAASLLLLRPDVLAGAVLLRAMVPLEPETAPVLPRTPVLLSNGRRDPIVSAAHTDRLAALLREAGAEVTLVWQEAGHDLTSKDAADARAWLNAHPR